MPSTAKSECVIIADVVSSRARIDLRGTLRSALTAASRAHVTRGWLRLPYAVSAGDEFQGLLAAPQFLPELMLDLRMRVRPLVLRVGAGLGTIDGSARPPVNEMGGEAFVLARRAIEEVKEGRAHEFPAFTAVRGGSKREEMLLNLIYGLQDTLLARISPEQWRTIEAVRKCATMSDAAHHLGLSASTISRNMQRAGYRQIQEATGCMSEVLSWDWNDAPQDA